MIRTPKKLRARRTFAYPLGILAAVSLAALVAEPALAQRGSSGALKIGVIDEATLLQQAPQTQTMADALQAEFAPRQRELLNMQQELQKKQDTYKRDAPVMGESERADLERQIRDGERDLQRANDALREDFNARRNEEMQKLSHMLVQEVGDYAKSKGYDIVLTSVVYASPGVDITQEVLGVLKDHAPASSKSGSKESSSKDKK
ncbi:MAG TPA: OmpH family outer membrane protein [Gammaproteobacteria bacterium]|nr:OmpH family outer membrane protein [Gammaproteobacteria bacterium]